MLVCRIGIRILGQCQQPALFRARTSRRLLFLTLLKSVYYLHDVSLVGLSRHHTILGVLTCSAERRGAYKIGNPSLDLASNLLLLYGSVGNDCFPGDLNTIDALTALG
jgi:hypothetical protein